jgi:hypothetical protein
MRYRPPIRIRLTAVFAAVMTLALAGAGIGLGLAIVAAIARRHAGTAVVTVYLPG